MLDFRFVCFIITNMKQQVTHCDVLPAPLISDPDAPHVCVNVRVPRFVPRFKMIGNERHFNKDAFIKSFDELPLSLVYAVDDAGMQVDILNSLFRERLDHHAPLKRTKVSRPPAPWMKNCDIAQLQKDCHILRALSTNANELSRSRYRSARNKLKFKDRSSVISTSGHFHLRIPKTSGRLFTEYSTQILNHCELILMSLTPTNSRPHQNVSREQLLNQPRTYGHLSTHYLMMLTMHSTFKELVIVMS